jgi:hypothetical protein
VHAGPILPSTFADGWPCRGERFSFPLQAPKVGVLLIGRADRPLPRCDQFGGGVVVDGTGAVKVALGFEGQECSPMLLLSVIRRRRTAGFPAAQPFPRGSQCGFS